MSFPQVKNGKQAQLVQQRATRVFLFGIYCYVGLSVYLGQHSQASPPFKNLNNILGTFQECKSLNKIFQHLWNSGRMSFQWCSNLRRKKTTAGRWVFFFVGLMDPFSYGSLYLILTWKPPNVFLGQIGESFQRGFLVNIFFQLLDAKETWIKNLKLVGKNNLIKLKINCKDLLTTHSPWIYT